MIPLDTYSQDELNSMGEDYFRDGTIFVQHAVNEMTERLVDEGHEPSASNDAAWDAVELAEDRFAHQLIVEQK